MKKNLILLSIASSLILFNCCDKVADATGVCPKKWLSVKPISGANAKAEISNGALVLSADSLKAGINLTVNQSSVAGDFEAEATFEGFNPGVQLDMTTAFFQFSAIPMASGEIANTGISNVSGGSVSGIFAGNESNAQTFANKEGSLSGTLKMKRTGTSLTVTTIVNSKSMLDGSTIQTVSTATKADYGSSNINIGFQFGAVNTVNQKVSVKVTNFKITGGGILATSDTFDCNSLL